MPWVKKQKRIAKLGLRVDDGFFTVRMLDSIQVVTKNLKGADPDDSASEQKWLKYRADKRERASQKGRNPKASKQKDPVTVAL